MRADLVQGLREAVCGVERLPGRFVVAGFGSAGSVAFGLGLMGLPVSAAGLVYLGVGAGLTWTMLRMRAADQARTLEAAEA